MTDKWPGWRYGPGGQSAIFDSEKEVPAGWAEHPSEVKGAAAGNTTKTAPVAKPKAAPAGAELDAHGHPFSADLHAATQSKTKAGLWRMKVGVSRPDPVPGYPLDL